MLDPVGAGASALRTDTAGELLDELPVRVVRGNMSEVKALAGASAATRGVDVNPDDVVTEENLAASAAFARDRAARSGAVVDVYKRQGPVRPHGHRPRAWPRWSARSACRC